MFGKISCGLSMAFFYVVAVTFSLASPQYAMSQSLTVTNTNVQGSIRATVGVPPESPADPAQQVVTNENEQGPDDLFMVDHQALSSGWSTASTNLAVSGTISIPGEVTCYSSIIASQAGGGGVVDQVILQSNVLKSYTPNEPSGGLQGNEVLVYYGSIYVDTMRSGPIMANAQAFGPNIWLQAFADGGVYGTVVNVFEGTTTNYQLFSAEGLYTQFAVVVNEPFQITGGTANNQGAPLNNESAQAEAVMMLSGEIGVFDASQFPTMTQVQVSD